MTLLKMIKKWEGVKNNLMKPGMGNIRIQGDIDVADDIIKDLKSIEDQQPSWVTIRDKIMKKIDVEIGYEHYTEVLSLAQALQILPG